MTVDELLQKALNYQAACQGNAAIAEMKARLADSICAAVVSLLSIGEPCGWPTPEPVNKGAGQPGKWIDWAPLKDYLSADEAREIAIMLLRAADEAEKT